MFNTILYLVGWYLGHPDSVPANLPCNVIFSTIDRHVEPLFSDWSNQPAKWSTDEEGYVIIIAEYDRFGTRHISC